MTAWRLTILVAAIALPALTRAEEPRIFRDDAGLVGPLLAGVRGLVLMDDGRAIAGRVVLEGHAAAVRVDDPRLTRNTAPARIVALDLAHVRGFVSLVVSGSDETARAPVRVILADGSVVGGALLERGPDRLVIGGAAGSRTFAAAEVRSVHEGRWEGLPIRTAQRYLEVPASVLPAQGNLRAAILQGAHLLVTWTPAQHVVVELGTALPVLKARSEPPNVQGAVRIGLTVLPWLALGAGLQLESSMSGRHAARLLGSATASTGTLSATLFAGPAFAGADGLATLGDVAWALAVSARAARRVDLVAEAWVAAPYGVGDGALVSAALRYRGDRFALDVGAARGSEVGFLPWIGISVDLVGR